MITSTHDVSFGTSEVSKCFRTWSRGEPTREWNGLSLLAAHVPGLAPTPLLRRTQNGRPVVVMSRLDGVALGSRPLTEGQVVAVARAMEMVHTAVPRRALDALPLRLWHAAEAVDTLRAWVAVRPSALVGDVAAAFDAGTSWIRSVDADDLATADVPPVLGHADGNLANFLWDGTRCGVVDFEDSGRSDRAFEIADLVEHLSASLHDTLDAPRLLVHLDLGVPEVRRLAQARRAMALFWLVMLLPGNPAHRRNRAGSDQDQARRLLSLLD